MAVATYAVIVAPPLLAGAVNATLAFVDPPTIASPIIGAPGTLFVVTDSDVPDEVESPTKFVATTVNV